MRICFIKNKSKREKLSSPTFNKYLLFIILSEIAGAIIISYISKNHLFDINIYSQYFLNNFSNEIVNEDQYFVYLIIRYCKEILIITGLNFTSLKTIANYIYISYKALFLSISLSIFVLKYGILGQVIFTLTLFPQMIIYYLFYYIMVKKMADTNTEASNVLVKRMIIYCVFGIITAVLTSFLEVFVNLKILRKIFW